MMSIPQLSIGHYTDAAQRTGLTVFLFAEPAVCGWWLCGSAPATRDVALLAPEAMVDKVDALLFAGGSAFGLGAANGVMQWLVEQNRGFITPAGRVPIVPTACIYDLMVGAPSAPTAEQAYQACQAAQVDDERQGRIGVGTGATVGKLLADAVPAAGGYGYASLTGAAGLQVSAAVAVNSVGNIIDARGEPVAGNGLSVQANLHALQNHAASLPFFAPATNSTLAAVFTNAAFDKSALTRIAKMASAGMARAIVPVFTTYDGDVIFSASLGNLAANELIVGVLAAEAVRLAIINAAARPKE